MKKENLFLRWLDHSLSEADRTALQDDERFSAYEKISQAAQYFRAPEFDASSSYDRLRLKQQQETKVRQLKPWRIASAIAAILVLGFLVVNMTADDLTTYSTATTESLEITLPDYSAVQLNAGTTLSFNEEKWQDARDVSLDGEAHFKVAKGSTFTVKTEAGTVQVLGTEFNVIHREGLFEVTCYEGRVAVAINGKEAVEITAGQGIKLLNNKASRFETAVSNPSWINNKSVFKSTPYHMILAELERHYAIKVDASAIDKSVIFTGSFTHQDLETALKAVTDPLQLKYKIDGDRVTITK
ncbi:FecR family protein [Gilvibacter sp.]|uniref:FecR family protein n=1 Tax=Gilvibacter sp. TaxID=2729997 RepID=UPI003F4A34CD